MRRLWLAIRVFFATLFRAPVAKQVDQLLSGKPRELPKPAPKPEPARPAPPRRSDAVTLLATLQREARLVDFFQESLEAYSDAQIGAAARQVHRDCREVLGRLFDLQPLLTAAEGAELEVPEGFDPGRYRLTGNVGAAGPLRGRLIHHGWEARRCELPKWTGSDAAAKVVAPAEVEIPQG